MVFQLQKPKDLFYGSAHILPGILRLHGFLKRGNAPDDGEERVNTGLVAGSSVLGYASGKGKDFRVIFFGQPGNSDRSLSHGGLMIQTALSGDGHIRVF